MTYEECATISTEAVPPLCDKCGTYARRPAEIEIWGYAQREANIRLCRHDALQLARKLTEDLCAIDGDRHG